MFKRFLPIVLGCALAIGLTSCYSASVLVGDCSAEEPMTKVYTKHNTHLIDGLVSLNCDLKAQESVGGYGAYKVSHSITFVDGLLRGITAGIYTPSTTKVYVPTRLLNGGNGMGTRSYNNYNTNNSGNNSNAVRMTHIVKSGETLQAIANAYQVTVKDIVQWNQLNSIDVAEGTPLIIFMQ